MDLEHLCGILTIICHLIMNNYVINYIIISYIVPCLIVGGGQIAHFGGKKPSSSFNYYKSYLSTPPPNFKKS